MIPFQVIIIILFFHFFADFICQTHDMGTRKSEEPKILFLHGAIYTIPFIFINPLYAIINGLLHIGVDNVTSKWTKKLYAKQQYHWFFTVIGFDQMIHVMTLFSTYIILI